MNECFFADSDDAVRKGDHEAEIRTENRVFADDEQDLDQLKQQISKESGLVDPNAEDDEEEEEEDLEGYSVDENGVEWFEDEDGYWWYREEGQEDWQPYEE